MPEIVRVTVELTFPGGGGSGTNTFHIRADDPDTDVRTAMDSVQTYYTTIAGQIWQTGYSARWNGEGTTVGPNPAIIAPSPSWTVSGSGAQTNLAAGVGAVVTWRSALASRRGRGRTFHTPLQAAAFDTDGTLLPGVRAGLQSAATALVSASTGPGSWSLVVYSQTDGLGRDFLSGRVSDTVAYLTSRRSA